MDDRLFVLEMVAWIEQHLADAMDTRDLVAHSGYSLNRFRQKFFSVTGETPSGYLRKRRLTEASKEILAGEPICDVCGKYGYSTQDNFTTAFRSFFGVTPKEIFNMDCKYKRFIGQLREAYSIMELANLRQPDFCSTLMGSVKGAADYFDLDYTPAMLFGLSGHIYLTNIHDELCPSGPYAWNKDWFFECLCTMGIDIYREAWFEKNSGIEERQAMEEEIRSVLQNGELCMLESLEYQLVSGFDELAFHFTLPWGSSADSELRALSCENWHECLDTHGFVGFKMIRKNGIQNDFMQMLSTSLQSGLALYHDPSRIECNSHFGTGMRAWEKWIDAVKAGHGSTHGNWWNGTVWAENRKMAGEFFAEVQDAVDLPSAHKHCMRLTGLHERIAERLGRIKEKELGIPEKTALLNECREDDHCIEEEMASLLQVITRD